MRFLIPSFLAPACLLGGCGPQPEEAPLPLILSAPDIGQGHAVVVRRGDHGVVIDFGPPDTRALAEDLASLGVRSLDLAILTHPDLDHAGGFAGLPHPPVRIVHGPWTRADSAWWVPRCRELAQGCLQARAGESFPILDGFRLEVLGDGRDGTDEEPNSRSLVVALESPEGHGLLLVSGDLDTTAELALRERIGAFEVVQLGHHGSRSSAHLAWLGQARPRWALVQAGVDNPYGHPTAEALGRASAVGADLLWPRDHAVRLVWDGHLRLERR